VKRGERTEVTLRGGPFHGCVVPVAWGDSLSVGGDTPTGETLPENERASYGPSREAGVYTFRGRARVVATLPAPGSAAA
jgi:hypothetical protein